MRNILFKRMSRFGGLIFDTLKIMDNEAATVIKGFHAGLSAHEIHTGYGDRKHEVSLRDGLKTRLTQAGYTTTAEKPYPGFSSRDCDLFTEVDGETKVWLEMKVAWKAWFRATEGRLVRNHSLCRSYLLDENRSHSLVGDFQKLTATRLPEGSVKAVLLIGFSEVLDPIWPLVADLFEGTAACFKDWHQLEPAIWLDRNDDSTQRECYIWWR